MSEMNQLSPDNITNQLPVKPRSRIRRLGCTIGVIIWIILLLLPCAAIALIAQGEIAVQLGDVPGQSFRVWLIQDASERGLGIARPSVYTDENTNTCLQTDSSFLLWMGKGEPTSYCECYAHDGDHWNSVSSTQGSCNP